MTTSVSKPPKDTFFLKKSSLNCRGKLISLDEPLIMGILNATPDSFYKESRVESKNRIQKKARQLIDGGAHILDIGGYSTRPGAKDIPEEAEWQRVKPVLSFLSKEFPDIPLSIDTFRSSIAEKAVEQGASIINDISGGSFDPKMFETVGKLQCPYVLMHIKGTPSTMQKNPEYGDLIGEVFRYFSEKVEMLRRLGVKDIILDPGFGFGKTVKHNYELLKHLKEFQLLNCPILAGVSRKSMINKVLDTKAAEALNGTTVVNTLALLNGADILRVHDTQEAQEAAQIMSYYQSE